MAFTILRTRMYRTKHPPRRRCLVLCGCGNKFFAWAAHLNSGNTTSCGCARATRTGQRTKRYPESYTMPGHPLRALYHRWAGMLSRCTWPEHKSWKHYGGRGITVCERWLDFENFLADMGTPPSPRASIDRIDNNGNYAPNNCRWATSTEQANNRSGNLSAAIRAQRAAAAWNTRKALRARIAAVRAAGVSRLEYDAAIE